MRPTPRVAAIHDLSCFGRCSLTVISPTLSSMGVQCCPLPTAVLSTHTGGFEEIARTDLTLQIAGTLDQWRRLGLIFDGVYTGYMASAAQIMLVTEGLSNLKKPDGITVVDPVLGDHGKLYRSITQEMVQAMKGLCAQADVITPNLTEAALLLGKDLKEIIAGESLAKMLSDDGRRSVVLTGVVPNQGQVGAAWYDRESGRTGVCAVFQINGEYHGTGDLFASVLTGALIRGERLWEAVGLAVDFVAACVNRTREQGTPIREGLVFEPLLGRLTQGEG